MSKRREIGGNTLRVYLYLLTHGASALRDVQRGLELTSASLASYHLDRLVEAGYARKDEQGNYVVTSESPGKVLDGYTKLGTTLVPQLFFFALLFTILAAFFSYESILSPGYVPYLAVVSVAMVAVFWFETARLWRRLSA